jgi:hypothetical protein
MYSKSDDYDDGSISDKFKTVRGACAICGAKPTGINFDVLTVRHSTYRILFRIKLSLSSARHAKHFFVEMVLNHW